MLAAAVVSTNETNSLVDPLTLYIRLFLSEHDSNPLAMLGGGLCSELCVFIYCCDI